MDLWERRGPVRLSWSPARARGGADGGFGEIGLCKSRLGEIIPVRACYSLVFVGMGQESDESFSRLNVPRQRPIWARPGTPLRIVALLY